MKSKIRPSIRRKRLLYRICLFIIITIPPVIYGSIHQIDRACDLPYNDLPAQEIQTTEIVKEIIPEVPTYDIPLSAELQEFTYEKCVQYDVDYLMALAIMQQESKFQPDLICEGNYGLMQINRGNHQYLRNALGTKDFLDPKQNIEAGVFWLSGIFQNNSDPERILMVYNMGGSNAQALWDKGRYSTGYSREVMKAMDEIRERQVSP